MSDSDNPESSGDPAEGEAPKADASLLEEPSVDGAEATAARARTFVAIVAILLLLHVIRAAVLGHPKTLAFNAIAMITAASAFPLLRRRPTWARGAIHAVIAVSVCAIAGIALVSGNVRAPGLWYIVCAPLVSAYLLGLRETIGWASVTVVVIGLMEASRRYFPLTPEFVAPDSSVASRMVVLVLFVLALAVASAQLHAKQVADLQARRGMIGNLLEGLSKKNEELLRARDTALAASRAKGDFLAMMSHEIRTPLNAVLGLTGVLLDAPLAPEQRELVRTIRSSGDSLLLLLNDILDFSKIEAGRLQLERASFDVADCAEDALDLFGAVAAEKRLDLSCRVSPDVPSRMEGDAGRVRQILVNLVSNAIKFTPRGSVVVRIDADPSGGGDGKEDEIVIHCSVRDTGIGIPEDHLSALFKPFSQVDASTTRRFGGTGLGLAICRTLAERMGGRVWAESTRGGGSTFHFTFVAHLALPQVAAVDQIESSAIVVSPRQGTREAVALQLETLGLRVVACERTEELAEAAASQRPDIVVADELIEAADAQAALRRMHRQPPFVVLSTAGRDSSARRALREKWGTAPLIVAMPVRRAALRDAVLHGLGLDETPPPRSSGVPPLAIDLPLRILIAEDNPVNQRVALLLLERLGYRADVVGNGAEAVEAVRAHRYDLVLMDVRMPEVDGIEATKRIRAELPAERQPRIVALTANAMSEDRKACEAVGMEDFLSKPITSAELERALRGARRRSPVPADSSLAAKEIEALQRLTAGSPEILRQLIDEYLELALRLVTTIRDAAEHGATKEIESAAHSLRGSSGQMGAQQLMLESAAVEAAAASGDVAAVRERLPMLMLKHESARAKLVAVRDAAEG